jgi:hypothetical protein
MTRIEKAAYQPVDSLKQILQAQKGKKFCLDCGHHVTLGHFLGNNIIILNGKNLRLICTLCG